MDEPLAWKHIQEFPLPSFAQHGLAQRKPRIDECVEKGPENQPETQSLGKVVYRELSSKSCGVSFVASTNEAWEDNTQLWSPWVQKGTRVNHVSGPWAIRLRASWRLGLGLSVGLASGSLQFWLHLLLLSSLFPFRLLPPNPLTSILQGNANPSSLLGPPLYPNAVNPTSRWPWIPAHIASHSVALSYFIQTFFCLLPSWIIFSKAQCWYINVMIPVTWRV